MTRPIHKVLIANRGEIAARIIRTCHAVGLASVAVFSDADEDAPYVRLADQAVRLGPAPSRDSYLNIERILHAAALTQADAIHPGYGFLAENADFAQAIAEAGRIFIGPTPEAIRAMGSKIEAKRRVSAAGVPIVPGYNGDNQDTEVLIAKAKEIGFPLLLKASAGGGGKGMRIVHSADALDDAIPAARREAENAFGDGALMLERYVQNPRHIEFQILGDHHGHLVHLFERECSIQRRHQKI
ncbi:MAG: biotin carboxylase N-terminal domain-containing protein, partial [Myxococcota bacterium]